MAPQSANKLDLYTIKGDIASDGLPGKSGAWSSMNLTRSALAHPKIMYGDKLLTGDLYQVSDEYMLNLYCPRCEHSIRIELKRKKMEWNEETGLMVEPFGCPWEFDERNGERMQFGINLCRWRVGIEPTHRYIDTSEGRIRIHGVARDA